MFLIKTRGSFSPESLQPLNVSAKHFQLPRSRTRPEGRVGHCRPGREPLPTLRRPPLPAEREPDGLWGLVEGNFGAHSPRVERPRPALPRKLPYGGMPATGPCPRPSWASVSAAGGSAWASRGRDSGGPGAARAGSPVPFRWARPFLPCVIPGGRGACQAELILRDP